MHYITRWHQALTKKKPYAFREDFCGTALIACEWVKQSPKHVACGIDVDERVLKFAMQENLKALSPSQQNQLSLKRQDVRKVTPRKFDLIGAYNYSWFGFHHRRDLFSYARSVYRSLNPGGTFFLDIAGGQGFIQPSIEERVMQVDPWGEVTQSWEQHRFDPLTNLMKYSMHFHLKDGIQLKNAFRYDWRVWQIRELREVLQEAGFLKSHVLWPKINRIGQQTGEFRLAEKAPSLQSWNALVVGQKS